MADDTLHPLARLHSRLEPAERLAAPPEEDQDHLSPRLQLRSRLLKSKKEQRSLSWKLQRPPEPRIDSADTVVSPEPSPDSEETVLSSKNVLTNFEKVASRDPDSERRRREQVARYGARDRSQQDVYQRLKRWADKKSRPPKDMMLGLLSEAYQQPPLPKHEELVRLAKHYYPPRGELKVHVCDFGLGRAEHHEITLGEVEEYWQQKPDWVDVRWIHAPLGIGLAHSSIEDIFLHDGEKGREFVNAGRSGWPYMETEVLNFRSQENFQEMRDVYLLLNELEDFEEQMEEHIWDGDNNSRYAAAQLHNDKCTNSVTSFRSDVDWRAGHLGIKANYWNMAASDMPWQLSEGIAMGGFGGPTEGLKPVGRDIEKQTLSSHPFFDKVQLVRSPFRTFHRGDGYLLTLSPMAGVNFLDKNLKQHLSEPLDAMFGNDNASAVGHVFKAFSEQGSTTWHRRTTEWFLVYLLSEVGCTPHALRQGYNAPPMESAYSVVIQDLVSNFLLLHLEICIC